MKYADTNSLKTLVKKIKGTYATLDACNSLAEALQEMIETAANADAGYRIALAAAYKSGLDAKAIEIAGEWDPTQEGPVLTYTRDADIRILPYIDVSHIVNGLRIFNGCENLTEIAGPLNFQRATSMMNAFEGCTNLTEISNLTVGSPLGKIDCRYMFKDCTSLVSLEGSKINGISVSKGMFSGCSSLTTLPTMTAYDKSADCSEMFEGCSSLVNITLPIYLGRFTGGSYASMFRGCSSLENVTPSIVLADNVDMTDMFEGCSNLYNVTLKIENTMSVVDLSALSAWGLKNPIASGMNYSLGSLLADHTTNTSSKSGTIKLHASAKARLTSSQIAAITQKGWTLA